MHNSNGWGLEINYFSPSYNEEFVTTVVISYNQVSLYVIATEENSVKFIAVKVL